MNRFERFIDRAIYEIDKRDYIFYIIAIIAILYMAGIISDLRCMNGGLR